MKNFKKHGFTPLEINPIEDLVPNRIAKANEKAMILFPVSYGRQRCNGDLSLTGFTLTELLVVIAIIGMLTAILLPTLQNVRERATRTVCLGNLKVIGEAFNMHNIDHGWPPADPVTLNNEATNIIKTVAGDISGLGYLYGKYIEDFAVLTCPSSDYISSPQVIKNNWDAPAETICTYIYRAESGYTDDPTRATLMLSNAKTAIVMDYNDDSYNAGDGAYNHRGDVVNILFRNGNAKIVENVIDEVSAPIDDRILTLTDSNADEKNRVFENADEQQ